MNEGYEINAKKLEEALMHIVKAMNAIVEVLPTKQPEAVRPRRGKSDWKFFSKKSLEELRLRISLSAVLSQYLKLTKCEKKCVAICPFHEGKDKSLDIDEKNGEYHCSVCRAHGGGVQFMMDHAKMPFPRAIETLAQQFGVTMEVLNSEEHPVH